MDRRRERCEHVDVIAHEAEEVRTPGSQRDNVDQCQRGDAAPVEQVPAQGHGAAVVVSHHVRVPQVPQPQQVAEQLSLDVEGDPMVGVLRVAVVVFPAPNAPFNQMITSRTMPASTRCMRRGLSLCFCEDERRCSACDCALVRRRGQPGAFLGEHRRPSGRVRVGRLLPWT